MTFEERQAQYDKFKSIVYYLIIGLVSILSTAFLPMIGTEIGLSFNFPNTLAGWVVWSVSKIAVATLNMVLFTCFMKQAKINVRNDTRYLEAQKILDKVDKQKALKPKSPKQWERGQYMSKGMTIFISSILSAISFSQAILSFDLMTFLSYTFTIIVGCVFGFMQMNKVEEYYTTEYLAYAHMRLKELEAAKTATMEEEKKCLILEIKNSETYKNKSSTCRTNLQESGVESKDK